MGWDDLAINALSFLGEKFDEARAVDNFGLGLCDRLALFFREQQRQFIGVFEDQIIPAPQNLAALLGQKFRPRFKRPLSSGNGIAGVVGAQVRHAGNFLACRLIDDGKSRFADPCAINVGLGFQ